MRPARLDLAISAAMRTNRAPQPEGDADQPPAPSTPPAGPPPRRRFGFARRLLAPVLSPVAHYARQYLQASVEHELRQTQGQLHALSAELNAAQARIDHNRELMHLMLQQQQASAVAMQSVLAQLARIEGHSARAEDHGIRIEGLSRKLDGDIAGLPGVFGPRFDELEIKQRPLIAYDEESMAIRMRDGYVLAPRNLPTFVTMLANATSRGLEPGTGDVLRRLVQPGMVVADVGANIGLLTLVMAWATGPGGRVIAFEPEAIPRSNLEKMRHLNGLSWVEVRDQAVGERAGRLTFHVSDIIGHSSLYALPDAEEARTVEVEVVRLDDVAPAKRLDVVKIDVEGAELDVLAGMKGVIAKNPDLAIIAEFGPEHLARVGQTPVQWFKAFGDAGFKAYMINETSGDCEPTSAKAAATVVSANIAFVRAGGDAEMRLLGR
ncbi:FkbM family methyltransferase [Caulobacter vibrioides]|uniref:FkbM family methyltransferase n=1 Tax=Caulobacter vibrioides TaxID=155892 RepID=UPI000BB4A43D|nr:FkbM family methyltransferase [Caulobacter vibrioides]ATC23957.1 FkbM family methyltransferase [Caulobacter vibrioides]AZH12200.1 FkbM family methyltransferase [Caulobacter vibrioides]